MAVVAEGPDEPTSPGVEKADHAANEATNLDSAHLRPEEEESNSSLEEDEEEGMEEPEEELDLEQMTSSVIEIFKEGNEKQALQTAVEFSTKAFQLYGKTHPTYINALATVAALVDRMGGEGEADQLLQQAEELQDEMEIEQAEQALEDEFEEELANAVAEAEAADELDELDGLHDDDGYDDYDGEESSFGEEGEEELSDDDEPLNEDEQEEEEAEIITQLTWEINSLIQKGDPEAAAKLLSECEKNLVESGSVSKVGQAALHTLWAAVLDDVGESDKAKELYTEALNCLEQEVGIGGPEQESEESSSEGTNTDTDTDADTDTEVSEQESETEDKEMKEDLPKKMPEQVPEKISSAQVPPAVDDKSMAAANSLDLEQLHRQQLAAAAADLEPVEHSGDSKQQKQQEGQQKEQDAREAPSVAGGYSCASNAPVPVAAMTDGPTPMMPSPPSSASKPRPAGKARPGRGPKAASASDCVSAGNAEVAAPEHNAVPIAEAKDVSGLREASASKEAPGKEGSKVDEPSEKEKPAKRVGGGFGANCKAQPAPKKAKAKAKSSSVKATKEVKESKPQQEEMPQDEAQMDPVEEAALKPNEPTPVEDASGTIVSQPEKEEEVQMSPAAEQIEIEKAMRNANHYIGMRKFEKAADLLEKRLVVIDQGSSKHRGSDLHLKLLQQYGGILRLDGDLDASLDAFTAADELLEERPESNLSTQIRVSRAQLWMRMGEVCQEGEDLTAAEGHLANAVAALEGLGEEVEETLRQAQASLARVCVEMKDYDRAEGLYMKAFSNVEPEEASNSNARLRNEVSDEDSSEEERPKVRKSNMALKSGQSAGDMGLEAPEGRA